VRLHIPAFAIVDDNGVEILAFSDENPSSQSCCNDFELEPNKDYSMHIRYDFDSLLQAAEFGIWSDSNVEVFLSEL